MKSKNGFTLVELLVVIVILGIVTLLSLPVIKNITASNEARQYSVYKDSLKQSAKLYIDTYGEDIFGKRGNGCREVSFQTLYEKGYIKDIDSLNNVTCNSPSTFVKVVKVDNKYSYTVYLGCGNKDNLVLPADAPTADPTCSASSTNIMSITTDPIKSESNSLKSKNITFKISSYTGINDSPSIYYGFTTNQNWNPSISELKKLPITVPGGNEQRKTLETGNPVEATYKMTTPENGTGVYYLVIKTERLDDLNGDYWSTNRSTDKIVLGPFTVDNTKPQFNDSTVVSTETGYHSLTPKLKLNVTDFLAPTTQLKMCITYDNQTACPTSVSEIKKTTGSKYEAYNANKVLNKIQDAYISNNHVHVIHITVADPAGNYSQQTFNYEVGYQITYNANGASGTMSPTYCDKNATCTFQANGFNKTGYTFDGWWTAATGGNRYGASTTLTQDITVYARWKANSYSVAYTMNGGSLGASAPNQGIFDEVLGITKPTKTFTVSINANGKGATLSATSASSAQTFAGWKANDQLNTSLAKYGSSNTAVTTAWSNVATLVGASNATTYVKNLHIGAGTVTLTANWTAVNVKLPTVSKTGYTCKFNTAANGSGTSYNSGANYTPSTTTNSATLYVICTANTYTVTLDRQSGSGGSGSVTATYDAAMPSATAPTRANFTFGGYFTAADGGGTQYYNASMGSVRNWNITSNTTLYAKWTPNTKNITYNGNGNTGGSTAVTVCNYNQTCNLSANGFTKTGYAFDGWYTAASGGTKYGATTTITADTTVYAHWKDVTGPTLTASKSNTGSEGGVTITVTCTDDGSGCNQTTYTYSGQKASKTVTIADKAGNNSTITVAVESYSCNRYSYSCNCRTCEHCTSVHHYCSRTECWWYAGPPSGCNYHTEQYDCYERDCSSYTCCDTCYAYRTCYR